MPGIAGIINSGESAVLIDKIVNEMCYFKQFKSDSISFDKTSFCHVSISTADIPQSDMLPHSYKSSKDGVTVIFHGNISNVEELRNYCKIHENDRDALILYKLYAANPENFYKYIKGSFNYIIHDAIKKEVYVSNDRFGLSPIYYTTNGKTFLFSSEIKPLLAAEPSKKNLNYKGCGDFFAFGYVMQEDTLFEGIKLLPPASVIKYNLNSENFKIINYYNIYEPLDKLNLKESEILDLITQRFNSSVKNCFGKEKVGFTLTGGVESRTNIASASSFASNLKTFTYGVKGCFDEKIAQELSEVLKTSHNFFSYTGDYLINSAKRIVRMTDGMFSLIYTGGFPAYPGIAKLVGKIVVGNGGEFARGFYHNRKNLMSENKTELLHNLYADTATIFDLSKTQKIFNDSFIKFMTNIPMLSLECAINRFNNFSVKEKLNMFCLHERIRKLGTASFLLKKPYLNVAYPFLDDDFIDILLKTPDELKDSKCNIHINIIKRLSPHLSNVVFEKTMFPLDRPAIFHFVGKQLVRLKKDLNISMYKPYSMIESWLKDELKGFATDLLFSKTTEDRGFYNIKNVKELYETHLSGRKDLSEQICALLTFELFMRTYLD